jgi:hypothetical protein
MNINMKNHYNVGIIPSLETPRFAMEGNPLIRSDNLSSRLQKFGTAGLNPPEDVPKFHSAIMMAAVYNPSVSFLFSSNPANQILKNGSFSSSNVEKSTPGSCPTCK